QDKTITEASVRRYLKLADADGISTLPTTKIFEQLALMGVKVQQAQLGPNTHPLSLKHHYNSKVYPTPIGKPRPKQEEWALGYLTKEMHDGLGRATTTASSLEPEQGSGDSPVQARPERLSNLPNKPPLEEDVGYYEIHKADRSYKTHLFFSEMLNDFDREDLIVLYILFNEKYASTRLGFDDLMLWGDMKIMFEPDGDDEVWKNHHSQELIEWRLYDSCGVHFLMLGEVSIHMLVEKKYPLLHDTLTRMFQWKLHVNYNVIEMAYELLRFIRAQLN
nr:hypothetical protein [Tanacetum cinerariifolium]